QPCVSSWAPSTKYSAWKRLPTSLPCMSGKQTITVSISPAPTAFSRSFKLNMPGMERSLGWCKEGPARRQTIRQARALSCPLDRGTASAVLHREFLLRREDKRLPSIGREIEDCKRIPDRHPDDAGAVQGISELEEDGHERDDHCERRADHANRAAIRTPDAGKAAAKLDEGQRLQQVGEHRSKHGHVQQYAADERSGSLAAHGEPHDQHHRESEQAAGDESDVRRLVRTVGYRQEVREVTGARQRIDLAPVAEDDGVEACDQAGPCGER